MKGKHILFLVCTLGAGKRHPRPAFCTSLSYISKPVMPREVLIPRFQET